MTSNGWANFAIGSGPCRNPHKCESLRFGRDVSVRSVVYMYPMRRSFCFGGSTNINVLPTLTIKRKNGGAWCTFASYCYLDIRCQTKARTGTKRRERRQRTKLAFVYLAWITLPDWLTLYLHIKRTNNNLNLDFGRVTKSKTTVNILVEWRRKKRFNYVNPFWRWLNHK